MLGQHVYVEPDKAEDVKTGIWLPSYYILNEGSKNYVWAVNDKNRIEKREVQLGKFDDTLSEYEITSGVTADDRLAVCTAACMLRTIFLIRIRGMIPVT